MTLTSLSPAATTAESSYPAPIRGAEALMDALHRHGVRHIFGYPGGAILPIYDALHQAESRGWLKHILVRHEQGGAHAADAYARSTGRVGVCFGTSGPGATNLVTGIATAQMDSVPMVVITGQVSRASIGTDAFQETDIFGITLPIVKHSWVVRDPADIGRIVAEAFLIASSGRPGPVLIDVPKDVGLEEFLYEPVEPGSVVPAGYRLPAPPASQQIQRALELIRQSRRPLLYVGGGAVSSGAHEAVRQLAERFALPVTTTLMGKGCFDERHRLAVGMLGMHGTAYANFAVTECDLLIAVGARFDDRVTGRIDSFAPRAQVIHIDIDAAEVGKVRVPEVPIVADVREALNALLLCSAEEPATHRTRAWLDRIDSWKAHYPLVIPEPQGAIAPQEVLIALRQLAPDAYITTDVGQHQMWAAQFLNNPPRHWISSAGLGTMGFGLPAALGVQVAHPTDAVVCVAGDASILMNIQELGTLSQYQLPVKVVIINNGWQGMVRQWQESFYGERYSASEMEAGMPDFPALAEAFGVRGVLISDRDRLLEDLATALAHPGPALIDVRVRRNENCYPMVPPGASNAQMVGLPSHPELAIDTTRQCGSCGSTTISAHLFCPTCGAKL
ncbi:biosynthetic-type acetolactate synthase large subunit [Synechococcus sp. CS-1325]|uniref:biosynthetic-type acetolactate synthase large subunit n=1 Tax=unclassified Synechococcus TaxID=2626047 RepID=UPI000DB06FAA|nr:MULTISPECIES: biosynthetic-type acetolactate synthase large subunit [unclassified Synechococcus]MCT0200468.1 biosynthetic-type acetolactate synthase large subunit [Synechococcus sp. CS-1325]MCT0229813.1 biosynthetic-type acetolactate synthase large subunit [Synechococcus sp. CS-1324]PZV02522.1 MAG: biosynthetic-type acetolactate synthase large subunit [Cyanobium sp.]PZV06070.1 MAG: biosynthetic-type acetolactate synthase large subunit [Cyanobium sp.]